MSISVFDYTDYKKFIRDHCEESGKRLSGIARAIAIQKTYVSMVLNKHFHFNDQQAFDFGGAMGLSGDALTFFLLLVQRDRAASASFRAYLDKKIDVLRIKKARLSKKLLPETDVRSSAVSPGDLQQYYLDWRIQALHVFLLNPHFRGNPALAARRIGLSVRELTEGLRYLSRHGWIETKEQRVVEVKPFTHFESDSLLSAQNHLNWRVRALQHVFQPAVGDYRYSSTISADPALKRKFVTDIKAFVARWQSEIRTAKDEIVFQVNMDLFEL